MNVSGTAGEMQFSLGAALTFSETFTGILQMDKACSGYFTSASCKGIGSAYEARLLVYIKEP